MSRPLGVIAISLAIAGCSSEPDKQPKTQTPTIPPALPQTAEIPTVTSPPKRAADPRRLSKHDAKGQDPWDAGSKDPQLGANGPLVQVLPFADNQVRVDVVGTAPNGGASIAVATSLSYPKAVRHVREILNRLKDPGRDYYFVFIEDDGQTPKPGAPTIARRLRPARP